MARGQSYPLSPAVAGAGIQEQKYTFAIDAEASDSYVAVFDPPVTALVVGMSYEVQVATANTGPATIDIGPGAEALVNSPADALVTGDIGALQIIAFTWDGTNFQLVNASANAGTMSNVVEDLTPQAGGDFDMNGSMMKWSKGADVVCANALPVLTDGNYFDITTGVDTVTSIDTVGGDGTIAPVIKFHCDVAILWTHHSTNLILPGGANIQGAAGAELELVEYAAGTYRCTVFTHADGTAVVAPATAGEASVELATGIKHRWSFNESSGAVAADSVGVNDILLQGTFSRTTGKVGDFAGDKAGLGSGTPDRFVTTAGVTLVTGTIAYWIFSDTDKSYYSHYQDVGGAATGGYAQYNAGTNVLQLYAATNVATVAVGEIPVATWTHVAFTADGTNHRGYKNGVLINTVASSLALLDGSDGELHFGSYDGTTDSVYMDGKFDEILIYDIPLSLEANAYLATAGSTPASVPLATSSVSGIAKLGRESLSVVSIADPSAELNLISGDFKGDIRRCYQTVAGEDTFNDWAWDTADSGSESVPYRIDGLDPAGMWISVGPRYVDGAVDMNGVLTATSPVFTTPDLDTPSALVGTNISGTASSLTVGATTGVEAGADVTDTTNVTAAGALMDSELTSIADVKALDQSVVVAASPTFAGATLSGLTASEIVITTAGKALASAAVATYPSLAELIYLKGVTSAIQTQISAGGTTQGTDGTYDIEAKLDGATDGNARGENAVDLCTERSDAAYVPSGANSGAVAGENTGGSAVHSFYAAGLDNYANTGDYSLIGGLTNHTNSGHYSFLAGRGHLSNSGLYAALMGRDGYDNTGDYPVIGGIAHHTNSGDYVALFGNSHDTNSGDYVLITGDLAADNALNHARIHGGGATARIIDLVAKVTTTDTTPKAATLGGLVEGAAGSIIIPADTAWAFVVHVVAIDVTNGFINSAKFSFDGLVLNDGGTVTVSAATLGTDATQGTFTGSVALSADTTNDALRILVTGISTDTIRWTARVELAQVD